MTWRALCGAMLSGLDSVQSCVLFFPMTKSQKRHKELDFTLNKKVNWKRRRDRT